MFCNVVYARLAAACPDPEARAALDHELSAPARGWAAVEAEVMARVQAAANQIAAEGGE